MMFPLGSLFRNQGFVALAWMGTGAGESFLLGEGVLNFENDHAMLGTPTIGSNSSLILKLKKIFEVSQNYGGATRVFFPKLVQKQHFCSKLAQFRPFFLIIDE